MKQVVIVLLLAAIAHPASLAAPAAGEKTAGDAYEFPVQPGTAAWKELRTLDEKSAVCQVPEDVLAAMSTPGLVQTCLTYPLAGEFMAFSSYDEGIDKVISRFNGLRELMDREDGASELVDAYRCMDSAVARDCPRVLNMGWRFQLMYVEALLGCDAIRSRLATKERVELLKVCRANAVAKRDDREYGFSHLQSVGSLMGRLLIDANYAPFMRDYDASADL